MAEVTLSKSSLDDTRMLRLAREIAMDIRPLEDILLAHEIPQAEWEVIAANRQFQTYLRQCIEEWASAANTPERVRLKSLAFVEESLPEFYARAHDVSQPLSSRVEVLKTVARFAGIGGTVDTAVTGEKFSVTINLGSDRHLKIERDITPQVIEGDA